MRCQNTTNRKDVKMMFKKIAGLTIGALLLSAQCFAMTFSQPVKLGVVWGTPMGGIVIEGSSQNNGEIYRMRDGKTIPKRSYGGVDVYSKGTARFGMGNDALYFYYDWDFWKQGRDAYEKYGCVFGNKDKTTVKSLLIEEGWSCTINKVPNDADRTMYLLTHSGAVAGFETYVIMGYNEEGNFVKYIDTNDIVDNYLGKKSMGMRGVSLRNVYCQANAIVVEYYDARTAKGYKSPAGAFSFKWDDKAQWFGVEHIAY